MKNILFIQLLIKIDKMTSVLQMDESEVYTLQEFLTDLSDCEARHVHVIADQSYSGELARAFRRSKQHKNVIVYASSRDNQYSYGNDFTQSWITSDHTRKCMKHIFKVSLECKKKLV